MYGEHQSHRVGMWPHITLETLLLTSRTCPFHWAMSQGLTMCPGLPFCCLCSWRSHQNATGLVEGLTVSTWKETSRGFLLRFSDGRECLQVWPKFKKQEDLNHTFWLEFQWGADYEGKKPKGRGLEVREERWSSENIPRGSGFWVWWSGWGQVPGTSLMVRLGTGARHWWWDPLLRDRNTWQPQLHCSVCKDVNLKDVPDMLALWPQQVTYISLPWFLIWKSRLGMKYMWWVCSRHSLYAASCYTQ